MRSPPGWLLRRFGGRGSSRFPGAAVAREARGEAAEALGRSRDIRRDGVDTPGGHAIASGFPRGSLAPCHRSPESGEKTIAIRVQARDNEPLEKALRRLRKLCNNEGVTKGIKRSAYYEKPSERRRRKERERVKALRKAVSKFTRKASKRADR